MVKFNKALFWSLFAAGGTLSAFVFPVLLLIVLFAAHGSPPEIMSYEALRAVLTNWFGKLIAWGIISLALWHSAHRMRVALHGFGLRADKAIATIGYGIAAIGTLLCLYYLIQI